MAGWINLLLPKILSFKNRLRGSLRKSRLKLLAMTAMVIGFWAVIFFLSQKVLLYFRSVGSFGDLLNSGLFAMMLLIFFSILLFSNLITSLSTFFLSEDLPLILSRPVSLDGLYYARLVDTIIYSSWMVVFFCVPVLAAYGWVYRATATFVFYLVLPAAFIPFLVIPATIGILLTMILVNVFPARSAKDVLILFPILFAVGLYFLWRLMKIEIPADPFSAAGLGEYLKTWLSISSRPFLPSHWVAELLMPLLKKTQGNPGYFLGCLWFTAAAAAVIGSRVSRVIFFIGWTKSQEGRKVYLSRSPFFTLLLEMASRPLPHPIRAFVQKDFKIFFRDTLQWSQLILLAMLVAVYLSTFSVLTFNKAPNFFLQNLLSFLNIGLAGFVLAAVSGRFAFTAVSQEGFSFWVIRSSPVSLSTFLWNKFWTNLVPFLLLAGIMVFITNSLLKATPFIMILSSVTLFFMTFGIIGLAVGIGAIYPRFKLDNPARMAVGLSGTLYMILSMLFIGAVMVLEIWPAYTIFMAEYLHRSLSFFQWTGIILSFCGVAFLIGMAIFLPMRLALKNLKEMDF